MIAIFSTKQFPIDNSDPSKMFANFKKTDTREYEVEATNAGLEYAAGAVITTVHR